MKEKITYFVMHKDRRVARIDTQGSCKIYFKSFMPYDLVLEESDDFDDRLNNLSVFTHWCASRVLTLDRAYAKEILNSIGATQSQTDRDRAQIALSYRCVSLRDVFWVRQKEDAVAFAQISLYTQSLDRALVDLTLRGRQMTVTNTRLLAGDLSTSGCFPKAWVRESAGFYLYKDGGRDAVEREVLASRICRCFACPQVLYETADFEGEPVSRSLLMTSPEVSIVPFAAYEIYCTNRDQDALEKIKRLDAAGYYMMNILDYLIGNTDRHWENWGVLVDNRTNRPMRLYDLMDFNCAFRAYDTLDGANCLTVGARRMSQREAAEEAVRKIGLNQLREVDAAAFAGHEDWLGMFKKRLKRLQEPEK